MYRAGILATGAYLPDEILTIDDFVRMGAERAVLEKWGIKEHRKAARGESATAMEVNAAKRALEAAGLDVMDVDLIIGTSAFQEKINPANVAKTQFKLGATRAGVMTIDLSCSSPIAAMATAASFVSLGAYKNVLIVASCRAQDILDPSDPSIYAVMGDGASAVLVGRTECDEGFIGFELSANGEFWDYSGIEVRKPKNPDMCYDCIPRTYFYLDGASASTEFSRYLVNSVPKTAMDLLQKANLTVEDIDWLVPHQNIEPLSGSWFKKIGIDGDKIITTSDIYGNMSVANIWVNFDHAVKQKKLNKGDMILSVAQGTGFVTGAMIMKWCI